MSSNAKKLMGAKQGKVAIKKTVTRGGKTFQQTFYVSPREAMAMQRKAKQQMPKPETSKPKSPSKGVTKLAKKAEKIFAGQKRQSLYNKWRTPLDKEGKQVLPEPPDPDAHVAIAEKALKQHRETLKEKIDTLKQVAPPGSSVKGRVKEMESAVGKVQRKPKYGTADKLQDLTGTRVIMSSSQEVLDTVKRLKERYEVVEEDDYITPIEQRTFSDEGLRAKTAAVMEGGYRSYHMIARDKRGNTFEIQLRTKDQNTHAEWAHPVYKPESRPQFEYARAHMKELNEYGKTVSRYFSEREKNPRVQPPPCPTVIARSPFGCIEA